MSPSNALSPKQIVDSGHFYFFGKYFRVGGKPIALSKHFSKLRVKLNNLVNTDEARVA
jgi:hypothetical protein